MCKWEHEKYLEENILSGSTVTEPTNLRKHIQKCDIPQSCGSNRNEAMHKTLRKNISRQRLGIQLALALLGIGFFTWNEKKGQARTEDCLFLLYLTTLLVNIYKYVQIHLKITNRQRRERD